MLELLVKLLSWRERKISEKHFILILSFLTGFFCALAAFILKAIIEFVHGIVSNSFSDGNLNYLYLATPIIGIFCASFYVKYFVKDDISHGVTKILYAISQRKARIKPHNMWSSVIASSLTIGFGGSVGAEAPIVLTGSAIGSNLGKFFRMNQKTLMLLVGCGASGAIAGIFKAPITGVVFTLEVLMLDLTMASIVPLLISAATASVFTFIFSGEAVMFEFTADKFQLDRVPYYILLGIICGFVALYFTRGMNKLESFFGSLNTPFKKLMVGGIMLSVLIFFLPPLYGEGYDTISYLLDGRADSVTQNSVFFGFKDNFFMLSLFLFLVLFFKIFASAATNGSGGTGGIFAPSLFMGCISGYIMAYGINFFTNFTKLPEKNFALAGMAGVMAGVMHAPLTGTFLIAEMTGGYSMFLSLIITSTVAYITILAFEPHSLYAMRLAKKGELLTHHKDKNVLTLLKTENVIEKDFQIIHPNMYLGDIIEIIAKSKRNIFPVLDKHHRLVGIVSLDEIRNIMFRPELYHRFKVSQLMVTPSGFVTLNDAMEKVMLVFEKTQAWNLPVVDESGKYVGFVSKSQIFNSYRDILVTMSDE
ncbi:MAG: chloride channel protein [Paludibacteraceae bacterium]|nr:chloride channel protein [Paludibacteraceae bacterium]HOI26882.1 chloride channel protein [Paludibacteraceae bacterium]HOU68054.1 chloride channel protein [Paludibacteraceae bacterium]HPH62275.1 chloride channel protein [Paludibacteraceae bacterium]HQF49967.1 chloride channel protein [Paludibacteraceae bacterium]